VLSWSISRDDKVKLTNVKIISTIGVYVTHRPSGARPQAKWAQGPAGRPNPLVDRPVFESVQPET
jgi:hypothetical protein